VETPPYFFPKTNEKAKKDQENKENKDKN